MGESSDLHLQIGGVAPNILRELSGIYPTFVGAFKELVSNAYDADATLVTVRLSPNLDTITIEDNGVGMTPLEFQSEYIRIGGSAQRLVTDCTAGGRRPIGRKGIGFLAVARFCLQVEVHSRSNRVVTLRETAIPSLSQPVFLLPLDGPFAQALAPFVTLDAVRCGTTELTATEYAQKGLAVELSPKTWREYGRQPLTIEYRIDFRDVNLQATIDYEYLLNLTDSHNLETLQDFCRLRLVPAADKAEPSFTRIVLHLREFVQHELQSAQRRGRVRNIASASGVERFVWHLSRSIPAPYSLPSHELELLGLQTLDIPVSPTPFRVQFINSNSKNRELKRPLPDNLYSPQASNSILFRQPIHIESAGLVAQGVLLGFSRPVFPAEMRGIAIRVRGVEIGPPSFLGVEKDLPVKYRSFLDQVMGEVIVTEGLDAIRAIMPGREGFYAEDEQFQVLRKYLVGNGSIELGALGKVLGQLAKQRSIESSAERIIQEARRHRETLLEVSQAITALSVGSRYGRALRCLFSRQDVVANGLCRAPECHLQLPSNIEEYTLELVSLIGADYQIDLQGGIVRFNSDDDVWDRSVYILGRDFEISLRRGGPEAPLCEIDLSTNTIYLNWLHPARNKMGDATFVKSALSWRIAYLAADGDIDMMMDLAHRLLSFSV